MAGWLSLGAVVCLLLSVPLASQQRGAEVLGIARNDGEAWYPARVRIVGRPVERAPWVGEPIDLSVEVDRRGRFRASVPAGVALTAWVEDPDGGRRSVLRRVWSGRPERFEPDERFGGAWELTFPGLPAERARSLRLRAVGDFPGMPAFEVPLGSGAVASLSVPAGSYRLALFDAEGRPRLSASAELRTGRRTIRIDASGWRATPIRVLGAPPSGSPLEGIEVLARVADREVRLGVTDAAGRLELLPHALRPEDLVLRGDGYVPGLLRPVGDERAGSDAEESLEEWIGRPRVGGGARGVLTAVDGSPVAGATLLVRQEFVQWTGEGRFNVRPGTSRVRTGRDGSFVLPGLSAGRRAWVDVLVDPVVRASLPSLADPAEVAPVACGLVEWEAGSGIRELGDVSLARLSRLQLRVADLDASAGPGLGIDLAFAGGHFRSREQAWRVPCDHVGRASVLSGPLEDFAIHLWRADGATDRHWFSFVRAGGSGPGRLVVDLPLRPEVRITGVVRDRDREPVRGAVLLFRPATSAATEVAEGIRVGLLEAGEADLEPVRGGRILPALDRIHPRSRAGEDGAFAAALPPHLPDWRVAVGGSEFRIGPVGAVIEPLEITLDK